MIDLDTPDEVIASDAILHVLGLEPDPTPAPESPKTEPAAITPPPPVVPLAPPAAPDPPPHNQFCRCYECESIRRGYRVLN